MARLLIVLGIAAVVFWIFSIVDCAVQPPHRHRGVSKGAWLAIVILMPVLGGALWFVLGRTRRQASGRAVAPDDDPQFLGTLHGVAAQDERIRLLEEELARLDAEGEDPRGARPEPAPDVNGGDDGGDPAKGGDGAKGDRGDGGNDDPGDRPDADGDGTADPDEPGPDDAPHRTG